MSDLNIRLNLDSTAAAAAAAGVQGDLNKLKTDAEKPIKINVDASQLEGAAGGAGRLKEALGNVQAAALGELSQKAGQLGASLGGVAGSLAEVAIKSAAAFGPVGIAITAVLAGLALLKQAYDEDVAATERVNAINTTVANSSQQLGDAYGSIADAANRAKTAEEARNIVGQRTTQILAEQLNLLASGGTIATAQGLSSNFDNIARASIDATTGVARYTSEQVKNIALTGNAQQQLLLFGTTMEHSTNAIDNQTRALIVSSTAIVQRITLENQSRQMALVVAEALRAAEQRKSTADESSSETAERLAAADLEVQIAADLATASANNLFVANTRLTGATADLAEHTNHLTDAEKAVANQRQANEALEARKHARMVATTSETAAQTRAGMEALRVAEQGLTTAGQEISVRVQQSRAEQALAFAVGETNRARAASARGGQTAAERTALVAALNAEATARDGVAAAAERESAATIAAGDAARERVRIADQLEMTRATENKGTQAAQLAREQAEADAILARSQDNKARLNQQFNAEEAARANEVKARNDQLAGSAGKLGEAQIAAAFAAAAAGENAGVAMQAALKASLMALAQESAIKALYATATGLFQLATLNPAAAATLTSAAMFAGVAVAAGVGAAAIPAAAAAPSAGGGGAGMAGPAGATPMRSGGGGSDEAPKNITINFSAFQSNEAAQALIVRSLREAGYNGRARVGSSFSNERR
jgi:hypothetical protein